MKRGYTMKILDPNAIAMIDYLSDTPNDLIEDGLIPQYIECIEFPQAHLDNEPLRIVVFVENGIIVHASEVLLSLK